MDHYSRGRHQLLADPERHAQVDRKNQVVQHDPEPRRTWVDRLGTGGRLGPDDPAPDDSPDRDPADDQPAQEIGERHPEVEPAVRVVKDVAEEPPPAPDRQRIDHDVEEHHQGPRHRHHADPVGAGRGPPGAEGPARHAERGVGEEGKRQRREERHVAEEELRGPGVARVVVEAERNPHPRGDQLGDQGHRAAPEQERDRPGEPEVPEGRHQEEGQEAEHVRAELEGPDQLARDRCEASERDIDDRHAFTLRKLTVFFKNGAGIRRPLC